MNGQQIGPYRVLDLLGRGGMGIVYQAMHSKLEQQVAIKVLSPEFSANPEMRERFVREAKLQVKLSHPNVVNILNYLEDNTSVYLVMEYVHGESLEKKLKQVGSLDQSECLRIALEVLDALAFMHKRGIIHRDIKPSNIMITEDGKVKVTDFGIAKVSGEKGITRTGMQLGTVWYMSPEQIRGENVDATSDMYALGITLYQMLTGQVPFHSDSEFEIMKAHVEEIPRDPAAINPKIPRDLCSVILKALAKNPEERFHSAEELRSALLLITEARRVVADMPSYRPGPVEENSFSKHGPIPEENPLQLGIPADERLFWGRFNRKVIYLFMGTAIFLLGVFIYILFFGVSKKEDGRKSIIPLTFAPVNKANPSSALNVTVGNGPQTFGRSPVPELKPEVASTGINGEPSVKIRFPQEQFAPLETEITPQTQPASSRALGSETNEFPQTETMEKPRDEDLVQHDAAPPRVDVAKEKKKEKLDQHSEISRRQTANRKSSGKSRKKPAGENKGWRVIK